jgi:hypothetical protein
MGKRVDGSPAPGPELSCAHFVECACCTTLQICKGNKNIRCAIVSIIIMTLLNFSGENLLLL